MTLSKKDLTILKKFGSGDDISLEVLENSFSTLLCSEKTDNFLTTFELMPYFQNIVSTNTLPICNIQMFLCY